MKQIIPFIKAVILFIKDVIRFCKALYSFIKADIKGDFEWFIYALQNDKLGFDLGDIVKSIKITRANRKRSCAVRQAKDLAVQRR